MSDLPSALDAAPPGCVCDHGIGRHEGDGDGPYVCEVEGCSCGHLMCMIDHGEERCRNWAEYEAHFTWSNQPVWRVCRDCLAHERELDIDNVEWARTLRAPVKGSAL